jgi:lysophospholipase L1-like esterase
MTTRFFSAVLFSALLLSALLLPACGSPPVAPPMVPAPPATAPPATAPPTAVVPPPIPDMRPVLRVMPLGDSITEGARSSDGSGYRTDLYDLLTAAGIRADFVGSKHSGAGPDRDHEGHSGWPISRIAERLDGWLALYRPDVILLHAGTNDLFSDVAARGASRRLRDLLAQIRRDRPGAEVLVARLVGNRGGGAAARHQRRVDAFNAALPGVVASAGPRFRLVDQSAVRDSLIADHVHPNDEGYRRMAATWFDALLARPVSPARFFTTAPSRFFPATPSLFFPATPSRLFPTTPGSGASH